MVLPLIKVASLIIKSASKPFAKQIKKTAADNPRFQNVVVACARAWHNAEGRMSLFVGDRQKEPKQLNAAAAVDLGSELASEGFLLAIAHFFEFIRNKRSANKDKKKEELIQQRFSELEDSIAKQKESIDLLQSRIVELLSTHEKVEHPVPDKSGILKKLDVLLRHQEENPHMKSTHENSNINKNP